MTEHSAITISNFIAGVIVAGISIVVIQQIVIDQVSSTESGNNQAEIKEIQSKITNVCNGNTDQTSGTIQLAADSSITLEENKIIFKSGGSKEGERTLECSIKSRTLLENTQSYDVIGIDEGYKIE